MTLFASDNVLVPIDFSDEASRALDTALQSFGDDTKIHVLHVLAPLEPTQPGMVWQTIDDQTRIDHITTHFHESFSGERYQNVNFVVTVGNPSSEIIDYADNHKIDLIVIPSHGRTGLSRFLIGSVSERVVRLAPCPVLVIRD
ncbi:MAG: universal stress protein [Cyanobacteria bacterium J06638_6]